MRKNTRAAADAARQQATDEWQTGLVFERLCAAARAAQICETRPGPSTSLTMNIVFKQDGNHGADCDVRSRITVVTPGEISMMDEAMIWPYRAGLYRPTAQRDRAPQSDEPRQRIHHRTDGYFHGRRRNRRAGGGRVDAHDSGIHHRWQWRRRIHHGGRPVPGRWYGGSGDRGHYRWRGVRHHGD
jgi:hypothetical protein